jgi:hypothetical protein
MNSDTDYRTTGLGDSACFDEESLGVGNDDTIVEQPSRDEPFAPFDAVRGIKPVVLLPISMAVS